jgi:uncharacterized protein involved in exopolysaccharide biosynthesis
MESQHFILKEVTENSVTLKDWINRLKEHSKAISIWVALVATVAGIFAYNQSDYYRAEAVATSSLFNKNEIKPVIEIASNGVNKRSTTSMARILNLDESTISSIRSINISDIQSIEGQRYIFMIEIITTDSAVLPEIFNGVNHLVTTNEYLLRKYENRITELDTMINKISKQVKDLQIMKDRSERSFSSSQGVFVYTSNIHSEIVSMEERLLKLKEESGNLSIMEYLQRPLYPEQPSGPNRMLIVLASIFIAAAIGVTISTATLLF